MATQRNFSPTPWSVLGAIVGAGAGFIVGSLAGMVTYVVVGLLAWNSETGDRAGSVVGSVVWLACIVAGILLPMYGAADKENEAEAKRVREERERAAERQRQEDALRRQLLALRNLCERANEALLTLPVILATANMHLDCAEVELVERCYTPFWEAIEDAARDLHRFEQQVALISECRGNYDADLLSLEPLSPKFPNHVVVLPSPAGSHLRLLKLYRVAQTDPDFANIYELRRNTATLDRTNSLLIAGFRSLNDAIRQLGDRVVLAVDELSSAFECRMGSIQESLEQSAAIASAQREAIRTELAVATTATEDLRQFLQLEANRLDAHHQTTARMLDNIQHGRLPSPFGN